MLGRLGFGIRKWRQDVVQTLHTVMAAVCCCDDESSPAVVARDPGGAQVSVTYDNPRGTVN